MKGYAIDSVRQLRIGNLLRILQPLVDIPETHRAEYFGAPPLLSVPIIQFPENKISFEE